MANNGLERFTSWRVYNTDQAVNVRNYHRAAKRPRSSGAVRFYRPRGPCLPGRDTPNTVVDDIATQAGIAKGTVYLYFPSKEQIYLAALLEEARQLDADSRAAMNAATTWQDKLGAYLRGPPANTSKRTRTSSAST